MKIYIRDRRPFCNGKIYICENRDEFFEKWFLSVDCSDVPFPLSKSSSLKKLKEAFPYVYSDFEIVEGMK